MTYNLQEQFYAIGDVHGRYDLLKRAFKHILTDSNNYYGNPTPQIVLTGDYIDGGPQSKEVLEFLMTHPLKPLCLKGNHEDAFEDFLLNPFPKHPWLLHYRSAPTVESLGIANLPPSKLFSAMRPYYDFISKLPLTAANKHFFLCHAGIDPTLPLENQSEEDLLTIRAKFLLATKFPFCSQRIIHGHTINESNLVEIGDKIIGIDTNPVNSNTLGVVRVDGEDVTAINVQLQVAALQ